MGSIDTVKRKDEKILKKIVFEMRHKKTGMIYPVKSIEFFEDGTFEAVYLTEDEQIEEHRANGGHYCSSCGQIFYDKIFCETQVDLIIKELEIDE